MKGMYDLVVYYIIQVDMFNWNEQEKQKLR